MITLFKKLRIMINQLDIVYGMAAHPTYDVFRSQQKKMIGKTTVSLHSGGNTSPSRRNHRWRSPGRRILQGSRQQHQ